MWPNRDAEYKRRVEYLHRERCRSPRLHPPAMEAHMQRPFSSPHWEEGRGVQTKTIKKLIFSFQLTQRQKYCKKLQSHTPNSPEKSSRKPAIENIKIDFQASQAVPNLLGVSIAGYINMGWGGKVRFGFIFSLPLQLYTLYLHLCKWVSRWPRPFRILDDWVILDTLWSHKWPYDRPHNRPQDYWLNQPDPLTDTTIDSRLTPWLTKMCLELLEMVIFIKCWFLRPVTTSQQPVSWLALPRYLWLTSTGGFDCFVVWLVGPLVCLCGVFWKLVEFLKSTLTGTNWGKSDTRPGIRTPILCLFDITFYSFQAPAGIPGRFWTSVRVRDWLRPWVFHWREKAFLPCGRRNHRRIPWTRRLPRGPGVPQEVWERADPLQWGRDRRHGHSGPLAGGAGLPGQHHVLRQGGELPDAQRVWTEPDQGDWGPRGGECSSNKKKSGTCCCQRCSTYASGSREAG